MSHYPKTSSKPHEKFGFELKTRLQSIKLLFQCSSDCENSSNCPCDVALRTDER